MLDVTHGIPQHEPVTRTLVTLSCFALLACSGPSEEAEDAAFQKTYSAAWDTLCGSTPEERSLGAGMLVEEAGWYPEEERAAIVDGILEDIDCSNAPDA